MAATVRRGSLADRLYELRKAAGLSGAQVAALIGGGAPKVSKIERGRQDASADDIAGWLEAVGRPELAEELLAQRDDEAAAHRGWRGRLAEGHAPVQEEIFTRTEDATLIRDAEALVVPGLLQTAGYARAILEQFASVWGTIDIDAAVATRIRRQDLLYDTARQYRFVISEAVLHILPCPAAAMAAQLDRLLTLDLPNIVLGIIPMGITLDLAPLNSFVIVDDRVIVESHGAEDVLGESESAVYARVFGRLMAQAVTGEPARALIQAARARLPRG